MKFHGRVESIIETNGTLAIPENYRIRDNSRLAICIGCGIHAGSLVCTLPSKLDTIPGPFSDYRETTLSKRTFELTDKEMMYIACTAFEREIEFSNWYSYFTISKAIRQTKLFKGNRRNLTHGRH